MIRLLEKTREMATKEAEVIFNEAGEKANAQSQSIAQEAMERLLNLNQKFMLALIML